MERARQWCRAWGNVVKAVACVACSVPILFVPFGQSPLVPRAAFLLLFMSLCWALTPWSIYVTALFPLVLLPVLGLAGSSLAASLYWNDAICLFLGSFVFSCAMEEWLLHRRLALGLIGIARGSPRLMLAAVMTATAFLSLFMSNTATAALMVPLVLPIIKSFESNKQEIELAPLETSVDTEEQQEEEKKTPLTGQRDGSVDREMAHVQYGKSLLLAVAYSASLGGVGTLIGTGPNVALVQLLRVLFPRNEGISFAAWMGFALVIVIVALVILWGLLVFVVNRKGMYLVRFPTSWAGEMEAQKRISYEEIVVLVALIIASVLWLTRSGIPPALPGWGQTHFGKLIGDGTVCVAVSCALFLIPSINKPGRKIMEASAIASLHWDVIILLGAGFAIGHAFVSSGLTLWIGLQLGGLAVVPLPFVVLAVSTVASFWTEVCSNVATANILLPIVASLALAINQNPLLLMAPVTISCSLAFMLPVATPPNALVMSAGLLTSSDMARLGLVMNCICVVLVTGWSLLGGRILGIQIGVVPAWANATSL